VLAKTYFLELEKNNPSTRRRIETQILHFNGPQAAAYTYRWNETQTDAELVPAHGDETTFTVKDSSAPGGVRHQSWRFNSRAECIRCHTVWNDFTPGFTSLQLDLPVDSAPGNQLDRLKALGLAAPRPQLVDPSDSSAPLATRARSYLHTNCGTCHRKNGGGAVPSYFDIELTLNESRVLDQHPVQGHLGLPEARILAPGDPERSVLLYRMAVTGHGHMPYVGSRLADDQGLRLVRDWIASLRPNPEKVSPQTRARRDAERLSLQQLEAGNIQPLDSLLDSASGALAVALALLDEKLPAAVRTEAVRRGYQCSDPLRRDLFERFLAPDQRRHTLGADFVPETILSKTGEIGRGKAVFTSLCAGCHRVDQAGIDFGPDLRAAARRYSTAELLEHIRFPSKNIDPAWQVAIVTLDSGESKTGFITKRSNSEVTLRQAGGISETLPADKIRSVRVDSKTSLMPEGLLQAATAQEAADLLAWMRALSIP
jgi:putative heme-binding domain-containing protein